jgi:hypothetical protein
MSTLEEIQSAVERLPSPEQEVLFRFLATRLSAKSPPLRRPYRTKTHRGGVRPGINADKLGQLPEDF